MRALGFIIYWLFPEIYLAMELPPDNQRGDRGMIFYPAKVLRSIDVSKYIAYSTTVSVNSSLTTMQSSYNNVQLSYEQREYLLYYTYYIG